MVDSLVAERSEGIEGGCAVAAGIGAGDVASRGKLVHEGAGTRGAALGNELRGGRLAQLGEGEEDGAGGVAELGGWGLIFGE